VKAESILLKVESARQERVEDSFDLSAFSTPLKIGFDGKRAATNKTGLGNYSRSLIAHLAEQFSALHYYVYTPKVNPDLIAHPLFSTANVFLKLPLKNSALLLWRSFGIIRQLVGDNIALFHGLSHEIPYGLKKNKIKSVVTIHDLIFLVKPNYYKFFDRKIYAYKSKYACKQADRIIAISEQTKRDIIRFYQINPSKIDVIYQSCDDQFKILLNSDQKEFIRNTYQLPPSYLLNVGTIEPRKNLLLLINALPHIDNSYPLVVIGKETAYTELVKKEVKNLGLTDRVIFLKNIPFTDLPAIYQMASAFIYPSLYEGFGIPIIEALYGGVPVVATTGSCLEEAGGPYSLYVSPSDSEELAQAVNRVLHHPELRAEMTAKGLQFVQGFNTNKVTKQVLECYYKVLSE